MRFAPVQNFRQQCGAVLRTPAIRQSLLSLASAGLLLGALWMVIMTFAAISSIAEGIWTLPCLACGGVAFWYLNRLHKRWEARLAEKRRETRYVGNALKKDSRLTLEKAVDAFLREEQRRKQRLAAVPRWKRFLKRFLLLGTITFFGSILAIYLLILAMMHDQP